MVRIAARGYGLVKNVLAACARWCSVEGARDAELLRDPIDHPDLVAELRADRARELAQRARERAQGRDQHALELLHRVLVEHDAIEIAGGEPGVREAGARRVERQPCVVLDPRQPLLLRRRDDDAIDDERRRGVVVLARDAQHRRHQDASRAAVGAGEVMDLGGIGDTGASGSTGDIGAASCHRDRRRVNRDATAAIGPATR
jgi:hypothetical protein